MVSTKFDLTFVKKEKLTKDTYTFYFDRVKRGFEEEIDFLAGQYFRITIPINNPDERGSSRFFTISSSPTEIKFLTITTRIIKSSFKLKLNSIVSGEKISFFGPLGSLHVRENDKDSIVFLAGGIGITPAHSILRYIDNKKLKINFTLIVSFSKRDEVIFYEELKEIELRNSNVKVIYTLTKEDTSTGLGLSGFEAGRINEEMIKKYAQNCLDSKFFIVGPPAMVDAMLSTINNLGISEEKIIKENFTGY